MQDKKKWIAKIVLSILYLNRNILICIFRFRNEQIRRDVQFVNIVKQVRNKQDKAREAFWMK